TLAPIGDQQAVIVGDRFVKYINRTVLRFSPGWRSFLHFDQYDRAVARKLQRTGTSTTFVGFAGQTYHSFVRAQSLGFARLELVAANSHVDNVMRRHAAAYQRWPIEKSWLNDAQRKKMLREYELADAIH